MTEYLFTGKARVSDVEDMINLMFTKDKVYNANMFREKSIPMLKENLSTLCKINDKLVGFTILTKKENNEILIHSLFVEEKHRRKGIATKLLNLSMYNAKAKFNDAYFTLHVMTTNEKALNLYKKLGFQITKIIPDFYLWIIPKGEERKKDVNYDGYEMEFHFEK